MIQLKRVYEPLKEEEGTLFLVERLWPRGIKKEALKSATWLKEVAPSTELRKWFDHDPAKWCAFKAKYLEELAQDPARWEPILQAARKGRVTLLYSARDTEHNNALVLKGFLDAKFR